MNKILIAGLILTAVALGRVPAARAAADESFAAAQKEVSGLLAKQRDERRLQKGLEEIGFKIRQFCGETVHVMTFVDPATARTLEIQVFHSFPITLAVGDKSTLSSASATAFLAETKDLALVKKTIDVLKAEGLKEKPSDLTPRNACGGGPMWD